MPWFVFSLSIMPWNDLPYDEVVKYVRIEFALRTRLVDDNGEYIGYVMDEKKYRSRKCTSEEFEE